MLDAALCILSSCCQFVFAELPCCVNAHFGSEPEFPIAAYCLLLFTERARISPFYLERSLH